MTEPSISNKVCDSIVCAWPVFPGQGEETQLCLGHLIEQSDRWGLDVPDEIRAKWRRIANKIGFHALLNAPGQPFTAEDYINA
jgi:hypothetical protein